ncbi:MAG: metallophosphoesterase [Polyangiaceae bacterium]|nr:metallophosphoesterase [Polyangiaceae bacterium]
MPRVIQLTDLHLRARLTARVRGIPVWVTLRAALAEVARQAPDLLVLTGDLADDAKQYSYRELREALHDWMDRVRILPGNHDNRDILRATFRLGRSTLGFADRLGGWHLIGVDTVTPKRNRAQFGADQLDWLAAELADGHEPVVLFTHHPPVSVNTWWLDRDLARDLKQFQKILESTDRVRAVVCGHVHHEVFKRMANSDVFMTPSTAYQFRLGSWWPARIDNGRPGLRILELSEDSLETQVVRFGA